MFPQACNIVYLYPLRSMILRQEYCYVTTLTVLVHGFLQCLRIKSHICISLLAKEQVLCHCHSSELTNVLCAHYLWVVPLINHTSLCNVNRPNKCEDIYHSITFTFAHPATQLACHTRQRSSCKITCWHNAPIDKIHITALCRMDGIHH